MNNRIDRNETCSAPMSKAPEDVTQTMLEEGMLGAPSRPGVRGAVGRFEILRPLGMGGMGQVFLARDPVTDVRVAIKMIHPRYLKARWAVERFLTEARHMYRMSHPHILKVIEVSDRRAGPYYVMPFVEGGSLAEHMRPGEPMPGERALEMARQVASALQYAHSRGIIHRDLKPANVLLDADGRAFLTDFGLLRTVFNDTLLDPDKGGPEGTAPYLSPLAAAGKAEDTRCDIYAFGAVLYEMLAGSKPYDGPTSKAIVEQILAGPPRPLRHAAPHAPSTLARVAEWCMARELRDRYAEMADVARDLDRVARGEEPLGPHGRTAPATMGLGGKKSVGKMLAATGVLMQAVSVLALAWCVGMMALAMRAAPEGVRESAEHVAAALGRIVLAMTMAGVISLSGWIMLAAALWSSRYRAPWFRRAATILSVLSLLNFPLGTILGIVVLLYLRKHREEFALEPGATSSSLSTWIKKGAIAVVSAILFAGLALSILHPLPSRPGRAEALHPPGKRMDSEAVQLNVRAWRIWREERYEEAEQLFLQAVQIDPDLADAWNGLGWSRWNTGRAQGAREAFERSAELDPKNPGALNGLGWAAKVEGQPREAIRYWERAVDSAPHATAALAGLAATHLELGDDALAAKHAQAWLKRDPDNPEAQRILAEARARRIQDK